MKRPSFNARLAELRLAAHERHQRRVDQLAARKGEQGQILILFALVIVVIMLFASIAIDLGVLRNNRQILANAVDSAALAGGTLMPVDACLNAQSATAACSSVNNAAVTGLTARITNTLTADYPGIQGSDYTITYRCIIGIDNSGNPYISRDIPTVCNPRGALGHNALASDFQGSGSTRFSNCRPDLGDKCNTVYITANTTTNYSFGRVVGVNSGNSGAVNGAACNGPCGNPPEIPVDVVVLMDRTASMDATDIASARTAAQTVAGIYDPGVQRIAVGFLGPSLQNATCAGTGGPAVHALTYGGTDTPPSSGSGTAWVQTAVNANAGANTLVFTKPTGTVAGNVLIVSMTFTGGSNTTFAGGGIPTGWNQILRTNNTTNLSIVTFYKVATGAEPANYTWTFTVGQTPRAAGAMQRWQNVDTTAVINVSGGGNSGNDIASPFTATTLTPVTTTNDETVVFGVFANLNASTWSGNTNGLTEQSDVTNGNAAGPSIQVASKTLANAGAIGASSSTSSLGGQWAAQHFALNPIPGYGTSYPADLSKWIPIGFTGTDSDSPAPAYNEAYSDGNGNVNNASHLMSAVNCFDYPGGTGTNIATPMYMAYQYLAQYGRPHVKWGIILETDGQPNYGSTGDPNNYTCATSDAMATAAKNTTNADGSPIEVFTIGFGLDGANDVNCPDASAPWAGKKATAVLASMATQPSVDNLCTPAENTDGDHFFCEPKTTDLTTVFSVVATQLAGIHTHLVQLYPPPLVYSITPTNGTRLGGTSVIINGANFTSVSCPTGVKFGASNAASCVVNSDTQITAVSPAGGAGQIVDIVVTNGGGSSPKSSADRYTFN